jgi:glycerol-3-phosphate dehydrogenase
MAGEAEFYDVVIIGAGVVGSAIAHQLSRYQLRCALLDAAADVGAKTSKGNTAIWHTGFDATPGSLEAKLLRRSYPLIAEFVEQAGIPVERLGGLLLAWNDEQAQALPNLLARAHQNGVTDARMVTSEEIYRREPHLNPGVLGGILVPSESIICTFTLPLAFATHAVINGVTLKLNHSVRQIKRLPDGNYAIHCTDTSAGSAALNGAANNTITGCRYLINAAGLYADQIDQMVGYQRFKITPRRGELIVFDKLARPLVNHILLPVPTAVTKGVLISPTVYGNVLLGPTAEDIEDKQDTATTASGLEAIWAKGKSILRPLLDEDVTAVYAGLRPATEHKDYQIFAEPETRYICAGGIRSTGLSASLGIAEYVLELLAAARLDLQPKADWQSVRMPNIGEQGIRPYQSPELIAADPTYGQIVCYCERVSLGEIVAASHSVIPACTLDGLRRRTRVLQGRCQGFNCQAAVTALLARESGQSMRHLLALEEGIGLNAEKNTGLNTAKNGELNGAKNTVAYHAH